MEDKITVIARFKAKQGSDQPLKELLLSLIENSRSDKGCISYDLHQALDDPELFVFYETWENKELLSEHSATAHIRQFRSNVKSLLAEPPEVILLSKISS
jgi:quinol monooxygenase YgiN